MIEWALIIVFVVLLGITLRVLRNMVKTLHNLQEHLYDIQLLVEEYDELVTKLNTSEAYYGDATIESFVKMSNKLNEGLVGILNVQQELGGEKDAEEA